MDRAVETVPRDHPQCAHENLGVDYGDVILIDGAPVADNGDEGLSFNNFLFLWPKQHSNFVSHSLCQIRQNSFAFRSKVMAVDWKAPHPFPTVLPVQLT